MCKESMSVKNYRECVKCGACPQLNGIPFRASFLHMELVQGEGGDQSPLYH